MSRAQFSSAESIAIADMNAAVAAINDTGIANLQTSINNVTWYDKFRHWIGGKITTANNPAGTWRSLVNITGKKGMMTGFMFDPNAGDKQLKITVDGTLVVNCVNITGGYEVGFATGNMAGFTPSMTAAFPLPSTISSNHYAKLAAPIGFKTSLLVEIWSNSTTSMITYVEVAYE